VGPRGLTPLPELPPPVEFACDAPGVAVASQGSAALVSLKENRLVSQRLAVLFFALAAVAPGLVGFAGSPATAADRDCSDFATQRAQIFFMNRGGPASDPHQPDGNSDDRTRVKAVGIVGSAILAFA
jgi:hypothetical protein